MGLGLLAPEVSTIAMERLDAASRCVRITVVEAAGKAVTQDLARYLDGEGVDEDIREKVWLERRRALLQVNADAA